MSSFEPQPIGGGSRRFEPRPLPRSVIGSSEPSRPETAPERPDPEDLAREAYERGLAEGRAQLPWGEAEELRRVTGLLERATGELDRLRRAYLIANRRTVVELAAAIAGRLLEREIALDPAPLEALVERAVRSVADAESVTIRVAPADLATLERGLAELLHQLRAERHVEIVADPELTSGGFRIVAGPSEIDARHATLLERIREGLEDALVVEEGEAE